MSYYNHLAIVVTRVVAKNKGNTALSLIACLSYSFIDQNQLFFISDPDKDNLYLGVVDFYYA